MFLPQIKNSNSNMKNSKGNTPFTPDLNLGVGQKFGLGIQVFKIQSNKALSSDQSQTRKFIKNIQNPTASKPQPPIPKKAKKLPSLQQPILQIGQKIEQTKSDAIRSRKSIGKRISSNDQTKLCMPSKQTKTNEGFSSKSVTQTKISKSINKSINKNAIKTNKVQQSVPAQKTKSKTFYWNDKPMNQLLNFYQEWQKADKERLRQYKKLSRVDSADFTVQMKKRMNQVSKIQNTVNQMVINQQLGFFDMDQYWEQNSIQDYSIKDGFQLNNYQNHDNTQQNV